MGLTFLPPIWTISLNILGFFGDYPLAKASYSQLQLVVASGQLMIGQTSSLIVLVEQTNFLIYTILTQLEIAELSIASCSQQIASDQLETYGSKPLGLSYFCELRLRAKFQLSRLCLSCISMVEEERRKNQQFQRLPQPSLN